MKYLIQIKDQHTRKVLEEIPGISKVGNALALPEFLLVESELAIEALRSIAGVIAVDRDEQETIESVDQPNPGWGLAYISNSGGNYQNDKTGKGVDIYVIDTGVRDTHADFEGRVRTLWSFDGQPYSTIGGQLPTHGTSVSACAAGKVWGTAKEANIVNLRIDFARSTILKALDMVVRDHLDKPDGIPSILNFSGSSFSSVLGAMFDRLLDFGIVVVAAGGNYAEDTPRYPAKAAFVVAIGANDDTNNPSPFTNKGCDVYAPGSYITTASVFDDNSIVVISGTSFSSPYYCGLLACLLEGSDKFNTRNTAYYFTWNMMLQKMDSTNRIGIFPNDGKPARTAATHPLGGVYYTNASLALSDAEINEFVLVHAAAPQVIADACREFNVSLSRLATATGYTQEEINNWFAAYDVQPWWYTGLVA